MNYDNNKKNEMLQNIPNNKQHGIPLQLITL